MEHIVRGFDARTIRKEGPMMEIEYFEIAASNFSVIRGTPRAHGSKSTAFGLKRWQMKSVH
jgi:hypothetical protein